MRECEKGEKRGRRNERSGSMYRLLRPHWFYLYRHKAPRALLEQADDAPFSLAAKPPLGHSARPCGPLGTLGGGAAGKGTGLRYGHATGGFETDITGSFRADGSAGSTTACAGATALQRLTMGLGLGPTVPTCCTGPCPQVSTLILHLDERLGTMRHVRATGTEKLNNMPNLDGC